MTDVADSSRSADRRLWTPEYLAETSQSERQVRVRLHNVRDVLLPPGPQDSRRHQARIHDLSLGGLVLSLEHEFEAGTPLEVEVSAAGGDATVQLLARVMQCSSPAEGRYVITCCFMEEMSPAELQVLGADRARPEDNDGRAWVRFPTEVESYFHPVIAAEHAPRRAKIVNISAGGVALVAEQEFEHGTLLHLEFRGADGQPLPSRNARVVHATSKAKDDWLLGCTFVRELSDADLQALM